MCLYGAKSTNKFLKMNMDFLNNPMFKMLSDVQSKIDSISPSFAISNQLGKLLTQYENPVFDKSIGAALAGSVNSAFYKIPNKISQLYTPQPPLLGLSTQQFLSSLTAQKVFTGMDYATKFAISQIEWRDKFPQMFLPDTENIAKALVGNLSFLNTNYGRYITTENKNFTDSLTVAVVQDLDKNGREVVQKEVNEMIDATNKFFDKVSNADNTDSDKIFEMLDEFIIFLNQFYHSKNVQFILLTLALFIYPPIILLMGMRINNLNLPFVENDIEDESQIKVNVIYSNRNKITVKTEKDIRSQTILILESGSNFKVLRKFRTWYYIRILSEKTYTTGFIKF
ncbi:MAG: hypothetical protein M0D53_14115 [Flavobacterium sp. JAD_PAG50586_2]|nr:MAG: hypothetical protein M0D53_14115 [Flavobacterium sp. JAD_PAG50586_2]